MSFLGIDPGASGGMACLISGDVDCTSMPGTERDIWDWIRSYTDADFAVIEQVGGYIAGNKQPGSAMFKFGQSYGALRMALTAAGIPYELVTPQKWQKFLGIPGRKKTESKTQWKNRLKAFAQRLFPKASITLATADAVLLAEYCRRIRTQSCSKD